MKGKEKGRGQVGEKGGGKEKRGWKRGRVRRQWRRGGGERKNEVRSEKKDGKGRNTYTSKIGSSFMEETANTITLDYTVPLHQVTRSPLHLGE